jgi:D-tyrosyl-tRNA(Tyr) deacylase
VRAVLQRVAGASVIVAGDIVGAIDRGLLVYLGVGRHDTEADADALAEKVATSRVFEDASGKMSLALADVCGAALVVPQFTLFGDLRKGRRPSFEAAAPPEHAEPLYERVVATLRARRLPVATGRFRATMRVRADVDGPVTLLLDTRKLF